MSWKLIDNSKTNPIPTSASSCWNGYISCKIVGQGLQRELRQGLEDESKMKIHAPTTAKGRN